MKLISLTLQGFKSFGRKSHFSFEQPLVGVVGPNGSGKSNIVEALRFVLGEQSVKSLRGGTGADFIFKGDKDKGAPHVTMARVSACFDNADRVFQIHTHEKVISLDFDTITITREIGRDGASRYLINDQEVRLRDILDVLSCVHIGTSQHHIISQGNADRLLHATHRERKSMIEDALGLKAYHIRIRETSRKLAKSQENKASILLAHKELEHHIAYLNQHVARYKKQQHIEQELNQSYQAYFPQKQRALHFFKMLYQRMLDDVQQREHQAHQSLQDAQNALERLKQQTGDEYQNAMSDVQARLDTLRIQERTLFQDIGRQQGALDALTRQYQAHVQARNQESALHTTRDNQFENPDDIKAVFHETLDNVRIASDRANDKEVLVLLQQCIDLWKQYRRVIVQQQAVTQSANDPQESIDDTNDAMQSLDEMMHRAQQELETLHAQQSSIQEKRDELIHQQEQLQQEHRLHAQETDRIHKHITAQERQCAIAIQQRERIMYQSQTLAQEQQRLEQEYTEAYTLTAYTKQDQEDNFSNNTLQELVSQENTYAILQKEMRILRDHIEKLQIRREEIGVIDGTALMQEYEESQQRHQFLTTQMQDLDDTIDKLNSTIDTLQQELDTSFNQGVANVSQVFERFFVRMFGGGKASLMLVASNKSSEDSHDEQGVDIVVTLPKKKSQSLSALSGGERSLTSIALLFALSHINPPPFLVLDETDAALDEANSKRYGDVLQELAQLSPLVVVTHNRETMTRMDALYGVTLGNDGCSTTVVLEFEQASRYAK